MNKSLIFVLFSKFVLGDIEVNYKNKYVVDNGMSDRYLLYNVH